MKECLECGKLFENPRANYCSRPCRTRAWRKKNRDKVKSYQRSGDERRDNRYRYEYGITLEDYNQMFADQNGCCDICGIHQSDTEHRFCVDHNHKTGEVRGLLCRTCNAGLGHFADSTENLAKAIIYLQERSYEQ